VKITVQYSSLLLLIAFFICIGLFTRLGDVSLGQIFDSLNSSDDSTINVVIWSIRAPRVAVSLFVGASLGLSGALIQLSTRSTLGDPNIFGIGGGATIFLASVFAGVVTVGELGVFIGCIVSSVLIAVLLAVLVSSKDLSSIKLALMGIAVAAFTLAIGISIISYGRVFPTQVIGLVSGTFTRSNWQIFSYLFITFTLCIGITVIIARNFYPVMLGDVLARSIGVEAVRLRFIAMVLAGILAGSSVYAGGLINFVGLISPHLTRRLSGNNPMLLLTGSALIGSLITIFSDQIVRLIFMPVEIPAGMTTTIIGAPLMILLSMKIK
tara:strand:- start:5041 stop:6012 length:972 start_codon:yes stop_codon:yes gene_type:complete